MNDGKMIAIVGIGAILPDAFDIPTFWNNIISSKYSVTEVPPDRWSINLYYDPDRSAVDKTYSKIGAFVKNYQFNPLKNGITIPPKVLSEMDQTQQWAIAACQQALKDYGHPERKLNPERVAVIFGNANGGENQYRSNFRILLPEYLQALKDTPDFENLPESVKVGLIKGFTENIRAKFPVITEDTMPGELSNIISGRVANIFNFTGPNFVTDAACASSLAAIQTACQGLLGDKFDAVLTGGIDRHMGPESYIKFSKIGALSADGSRPYADGANGFVMGEGAVVFIMKRFEDAEHDGDKIYAVIRGIGASSDGRGKGITAPNPAGQQLAITRAWQDAQVNPEAVGLIEGHGTSTKVGDIAEVNSLNAIFGSLGLKSSSVVLGSVKSNIGHLKGAAGAAGLLKTILSLYHHVLPPTVYYERLNPNIDFSNLPFRIINSAQDWEIKAGNNRFAGVSAFGFGGTNFHMVLEEYFPGMVGKIATSYSSPARIDTITQASISDRSSQANTSAIGVSANTNFDVEAVKEYVLSAVSEITGYPVEMLEMDLDLEADLGIDTVKQAELFATVRTNYGIPRREDLILSDYNTLAKVVKFITDAIYDETTPVENHSISNTENAKQPGVNLKEKSDQIAELRPYQGLYFASAEDVPTLRSKIEEQLKILHLGGACSTHCPSQQELGREERIAIDFASDDELIIRLEKTLSAFENESSITWKAMQTHGVFRGSGKPGKVAFLFPGQGSQYVNMLLDLRDTEPLVRDTFDEADRVMTPILGRPLTSFIYTNGTEEEMKRAEQELKDTAITQPAMLTANVAIMRVLNKYGIYPDMVIGHSLGEYAALVAAGVLTFPEALEVVSARSREMSKIKAEDPGCMAAVSAPIEKVEEVIKSIEGYVVIANINSPLQSVLGGSTKAIEDAISKFNAEGYLAVKIPVSHAFHTKIVAPASEPLRSVIGRMNVQKPKLTIIANVTGEVYPTEREEILDILSRQVASPVQFVKGMQTLYNQGARIFIESGPKRVLNALAQDNLKDHNDVTIIATNHPRKGGKSSFNGALCGIYAAGIPYGMMIESQVNTNTPLVEPVQVEVPATQISMEDNTLPITGSVVISGLGLGLPGKDRHVFDDDNFKRILSGDMRIESLPENSRQAILDKHVTRLIKSEAGAVMEEINDLDQVLKLAGQGGEFDLASEFGIPEDRVDSLDVSSKLAMAAGIEALRDAGIPLVMSYRRTTTGTLLPDRWKLPESMRDETGVIFGSAFPGLNRIVEEADRFYEAKMLDRQLQEVMSLIDTITTSTQDIQSPLLEELHHRAEELKSKINEANYHFDRRYIFRILSMGHSQFAEYIGARGPNTHVNNACATTTHAVSIAEDWIRSGRCRRVVIIAGDDVTKENSLAWVGTSLFSSGAATTEGTLRLAAIPFDKRRNGMIIGMGAAALVIESEDAACERGVRGIGEILSTNTANSAFHGTRLDVQHIGEVMDRLLQTAEKRFGINRRDIAPETVFMSHETYTPARGGSASAEIRALRHCFGEAANQVIIANTKGFTGHSMGVGIEDVVVTKALETGFVPPIAHINESFEPEPELGDLNLSRGGVYNPQYALRLGAGFGSQIAMTLVRRIPGVGERIDHERYSQWLAAVSGYEAVELEVVQRTLRIKDKGVPMREPLDTPWQYGQLPSLWTLSNIQSGGRMDEVRLPAPETVAVKTEEQKDIILPQAQPISIVFNPASEAIKEHILLKVSKKTGYPVEMLDLDLDLEADLGIDTVKQAELFSAVRTYYGIPRRGDLILADYNTLAKVIGFVQGSISTTENFTRHDDEVQSINESDNVALVEAGNESSKPTSLSFRVPTLVMIPKTDLCTSTGVELENRDVMIVTDSSKVGAVLTKKLKSLKASPVLVEPVKAQEKIEQLVKSGNLTGVYYLTPLDEDPNWMTAESETWLEKRRQRVDTLYEIAKVLPESAFLICATRMGGLQGFIKPENPMGGLVSGFAKALRRERSNQLIKTVDFSSGVKNSKIVELLIDETLHDPMTTEIGYEGDSRFSATLREMKTEDLPQTALVQNGVYVVSGASGGITGSILVDLAKNAQGTFFLLGRTELPAKDDADIELLKADKNAFRIEMQKRLSAPGKKVTPVQLDQKIMALERAASLLDVIDEIRSSGGKAFYLVCDVRDMSSVEAVAEEIRKTVDHVDFFIHAAGIEKSRKIERKSKDEFEQTVSVKADGLYFLIRSLENYNLLPGSVVFFSSVAGRFGNSGQTDYSAANDMLSKFAFWLPTVYPGMKTISIDWGAWAEVGMASRGSIPRLMERAGIEMLKPAVAAPMVRRALQHGLSGEFVVTGSLGWLEESSHSNCGLDVLAANEALCAGKPIHNMFSHLTGFDVNNGIRLEAELDPTQVAYLRDHMINGTPVLPGVIGIEGFSITARHIASVLGSNNGGFEVDRLENIHFLSPFKFYGNKSRIIKWNAVAYRLTDGIKIEATLESDITRRNGKSEHMLHFTGDVFLTQDQNQCGYVATPPKWSGKNLVSSDEIYNLYFHGPSFQVLESAQASNGALLGKFNKKSVEMAADDPNLFITPLLIEMCFQTAGLFEVGATGTLALPQSIGTLKLFQQPLNGVAIYAEVKPHKNGENYSFDARVIDAKGNIFLELTDYYTSAFPYPTDQRLIEPMKKLVLGSVG